MNTRVFELKDLLDNANMDKKKLYEGILKRRISCVIDEHSSGSKKLKNYELKRDIFQVMLDVNDYLLKNQKYVDNYTQQQYTSILRVMMDPKSQKLYKDITENISVLRIYLKLDGFSIEDGIGNPVKWEEEYE